MQSAPAQQLAGINTGNPFAQGPDGTAVNAEAFLRALRANSQMMATLPEPARRIVEVCCCADGSILPSSRPVRQLAEMNILTTGNAQNAATRCEFAQPVRAGNMWACNGQVQQVVPSGMPFSEMQTCDTWAQPRTLCHAVHLLSLLLHMCAGRRHAGAQRHAAPDEHGSPRAGGSGHGRAHAGWGPPLPNIPGVWVSASVGLSWTDSSSSLAQVNGHRDPCCAQGKGIMAMSSLQPAHSLPLDV